MSFVNRAFFSEQFRLNTEPRKIIKDFDSCGDTLDLIILPGIPRTGTSVLFQCLESMSGYSSKMPVKLLGTPPSEHMLWRVANWIVSKRLGVKSLHPGSAADKGMFDVLIGEFIDKPLDKNTKQEMDNFIDILKWQRPRVLKEPMCLYALQAWIDNYDCFKNAKYIWTRRDPVGQAKSWVRLKTPRLEPRFRGTFTVNRAKKIGIGHDKILAKIMSQVNHIEVWHKDLLNDTDNTFTRLSEFIGRRVNRGPFNKGKAYGCHWGSN